MINERLPLEREPEKLDIKTAPLPFTDHALARFKERWKPLDEFDLVPENDQEWTEKLETLIRDSSEVSLGKTVTVKRLIDGDFKNARYFYNKTHDLRFVTREENGALVVVTVENPIEKSGTDVRYLPSR